MNNGVMTMRPVKDRLSRSRREIGHIGAGRLPPTLMELKAPFKKGDKIPVTLKFEKAGDVNVTLDVRDIGVTAPASGQMDHVEAGHWLTPCEWTEREYLNRPEMASTAVSLFHASGRIRLMAARADDRWQAVWYAHIAA